MNRILFFLVLIFFSFLPDGYGQSIKESTVQNITQLHNKYLNGAFSKESYFDTINKAMSQIFNDDISFSNKELLELLSPYRTAIWQYNVADEKIKYYGILSNQAQKNGRLGEMRYYAEKINEAEQSKNKQPSITAMTIIADYYNTLWSYENTKELFLSNKDFIKTIPQKAKQDEIDIRKLVQAGMMLEKMAIGMYELKDTLNADDAMALIDTLFQIAQQKYSDKQFELSYLEFALLHTHYAKGKGLMEEHLIKKSIAEFTKFQAKENTPDNLKSSIDIILTDIKIILFLDKGNVDSAKYYINNLKSSLGEEPSMYNKYMLLKYESRLMYEQGEYKSSIETLKEAIIISEQNQTQTLKDVNDMMYAQAKADEQQIQLEEAKMVQEKSERKFTLAMLVLLLIIAGSLIIIRYYKYKQKKKFLAFKLNLARSIHDEANPALLYAKILVKTASSINTDKTTIERHIDHSMQLIRSLSHDLKSIKQYNLSDLTNKISETLQKLSKATGFSFHITNNSDKKRFISHFQYTQLKAILNECIANSIKYATFDSINIGFEQTKKNLLIITYADNGEGWNETMNSNGIGLKNIEERVSQLNGNWKLNNRYPNGYNITFSILLK